MLKLAVPDLVSNSYFPAEAAVELGLFRDQGLDVSLRLIFPVNKAYEALRDGEVDIVAGSAHSALAAFPGFRGVRLLCAQSQGMYWFLVMHADFAGVRGDLSVVRGKRIGAAPWVEMGLRRALAEAGVDSEAGDVTIAPIPPPPGGGAMNFGLNAARALEERLIDGFWANGMAAEIATRSGVGTVVFDARRDASPADAFGYTFASVATRASLPAERPEEAAAIVRGICAAQSALRSDVSLAARVGQALFPAREAALITDIVRRDLPFYDAAISRETVNGMSRFARALKLADDDLVYEDVVSAELAPLWSA
ncbi:MAG: nitrate ABC transporter substrate-binding protein [Rhizobiales bacterium 65-9]|nr:ABC transporter substrate-binding protein [Hyphomicrobiales bacterium]OJY38430.1 MAG: nitrate ABC transporter substrate-binding protein [Rhizobiales bacterium 65-9]